MGLAAQAETLINYDAASLLAGRDASQRFHSRFAYGGTITPVPFNGIGPGGDEAVRVDRLAWFTDWHPWRGGFHLSGGVLLQDSAVGSRVLEEALAHQRKFSTTSLLDHGDDGVTPYVGLGWSTAVTHSGRLGLTLDMGLLYGGATYSGQSDVRGGTWSSGGGLAGDLAPLNLSPVFSLGLSYSF